jgi:hypothetical protein
MTKPATPAELRKLLMEVLKKYEDAFCTIAAMIETLKQHGVPIDKSLDELARSQRIRGLVHASFEPLMSAIESEDAEALQKALLDMPPSKWKM